MVGKISSSRIVFLVFAYALLMGIAFVCLMPIWHVTMSSISNPSYLTVNKGIIFLPLNNADFTA